jgi:predicted DNA binding protein
MLRSGSQRASLATPQEKKQGAMIILRKLTEAEIKARGAAFEAGYFDRSLNQSATRWELLWLRTPDRPRTP